MIIIGAKQVHTYPSFAIAMAIQTHATAVCDDLRVVFFPLLSIHHVMLGLFGGLLRSFAFSRPIVASAYYKHISDLMAEIADVTGHEADVPYYSQRSAARRTAYAAEFIDANGRIQPDKQASYVRVLQFDLAPSELRPKVAARLVELIRAGDHHLGTGVLSTGYLCQVVTDAGYRDVAYDLLNQNTIPSWLYPIEKGATTMWESWDAIRPDGSIKGLISHNHYFIGAVAEWLYRVVAGLEIGEPRYKQVSIRPRPGGGLSNARASYQSLYGEIVSSWHIDGDHFTLGVTVPPNVTTTGKLPDETEPVMIGSGYHTFTIEWSNRTQ